MPKINLRGLKHIDGGVKPNISRTGSTEPANNVRADCLLTAARHNVNFLVGSVASSRFRNKDVFLTENVLVTPSRALGLVNDADNEDQLVKRLEDLEKPGS